MGGAALLTATAIDATMPSRTMLTTLVFPATMVAVVVFWESGVPVAVVLAYVISVNVSWPAGALRAIEHVRPPDVGTQFAEPGARFTMMGVPPFTAIDADCVFTETYAGLRRVDVAAVPFAGMLIAKVMLCGPTGVAGEPGPAGAREAPLPP
jgi:hypothetical protein